MSVAVSRIAGAYAAAALAEGLRIDASRQDLADLATELDRHLQGAGVIFDRYADTVVVTKPGEFSHRHRHLLTQLAHGHSIGAVARVTGRHERTVARDAALVRLALGVRSLPAAVGAAVHLGLIPYVTGEPS